MAQPKPLTYLARECVIEHMDPDWRYLNASRFPFISSEMLKNVPLLFKNMKIDKDSITVDEETRVEFGGYIDKTAWERLKNLFGDGTPIIRNLKICSASGVPSLLLGRKDIRNLILEDTKNKKYVFDVLKPLLKRPLKSLTFFIHNFDDPILKHAILKEAKVLNLIVDLNINDCLKMILGPPIPEDDLTEKHFPLSFIQRIITNWIENPMEIGKKFSMKTFMVHVILDLILGEMKEFKETKIAGKPHLKFSYGLTMPLAYSAELNIYGIEHPNWKQLQKRKETNQDTFVMEVMEMGSAKLLD